MQRRAALAWISSVAVKLVDRSLVAAFALIVIVVFPTYRFFELEMSVYDVLQKTRSLLYSAGRAPLMTPVVVVEVDDEAIRSDGKRRLQRGNMTSRSYLADALLSIVNAKPKVIALDYVLDEPAAQARDDLELEKALVNAANNQIPVVLATRLVDRGISRVEVRPLPNFLVGSRPDGALIRLGHVNIEKYRTDGVVREAAPAKHLQASLVRHALTGEVRETVLSTFQHDGHVVSPSFALQILLAELDAEGRQDRAATYEVLRRGRTFIDFPFVNDHPLYSVSSARLGSELANAMMLQSIVILANGDSQSIDRHKTPLSTPSMLLPGLVLLDALEPNPIGANIHVAMYRTFAAQLKDLRTIRAVNQWLVVGLVCLLMTAAAIWLVPSGDFAKFFWFSGVVFALYSIAVLALFHLWLIYLPIVRPIAMMLLVALAVRGFQRSTQAMAIT